ncbi:MAG: hypothetical protein AAF598_00905 [Bacteroidota bacterium]
MKPLVQNALLFFCLCGILQACSPGNIVYYTFEEFPLGAPVADPAVPYIINNTNPIDSTKGIAWYAFEGETVLLQDQDDYPFRIVNGTALPGQSLRYNCENPLSYSNIRMSFFAEEKISLQSTDSISFSWMGIPQIGLGNRSIHIVGNLRYPNNIGVATVFNIRITNTAIQLGSWNNDELEFTTIGTSTIDQLQFIGILLDLNTETMDIRLETSAGLMTMSNIDMLSQGMENPPLSSSRPTLNYYWEADSYNSSTYYTLDQVRISKRN